MSGHSPPPEPSDDDELDLAALLHDDEEAVERAGEASGSERPAALEAAGASQAEERFDAADVMSDLAAILGKEEDGLDGGFDEGAGREGEDALSDEERQIAETLEVVLRSLSRELRARRGATAGMSSSLGELASGMMQLLSRHGEIHLRVGIDGLYYRSAKVLEVSPYEDKALFRVFQHGVRQFSFYEGLELDELDRFVTVLTTDPDALDSVEEDISTLLVDQEFESIGFVVVDTFTETGAVDEADQRRAAELADIVAAAIRETLSSNPELADGGAGGSIRFMAADVKFFEEADLGALVRALRPEGEGSAAGRDDDAEVRQLGEALVAGVRRPGPWLCDAVVRALDGATAREAAALGHLLATSILVDVRRDGLGAVGETIDGVGRWLDEVGLDERAAAVRGAIFSKRLGAPSIQALKGWPTGGEAVERVATEILRRLDPAESGKALVEVCLIPENPARDNAIEAILTRGAPDLEPLAEALFSLDTSAARRALGALEARPAERPVVAVFQSALDHADPEVRAAAVRWFVRFGGDRAAGVLSDALRDGSSIVRLIALSTLVEKAPSYGPALLKTWFDGSEFRKLPMEEKRLGARALAAVVGPTILPMLRKLVKKMNLTGDQMLDEHRAAAVAALGALGDRAVEAKIAKLAKSRLCGPALQEEAAFVSSALRAERVPYGDLRADISRLLEALGVVPEPGGEGAPAQRPASTPEPAPAPEQATPEPVEVEIALEDDRPPRRSGSRCCADDLLASYLVDDVGGEAQGDRATEVPGDDRARPDAEMTAQIAAKPAFAREARGGPATGDATASGGLPREVLAELLAGWSFDDLASGELELRRRPARRVVEGVR